MTLPQIGTIMYRITPEQGERKKGASHESQVTAVARGERLYPADIQQCGWDKPQPLFTDRNRREAAVATAGTTDKASAELLRRRHI